MKTCKTCESIRIGHPDKLCDFIADFILDSCLEVDPDSRVACEVSERRLYKCGCRRFLLTRRNAKYFVVS